MFEGLAPRMLLQNAMIYDIASIRDARLRKMILTRAGEVVYIIFERKGKLKDRGRVSQLVSWKVS